MELKKREISVDRVTADESMQFMLKGKINTPDANGDIDRLIFCDADCFLLPDEINTSKLDISGDVRIDLICLNRSGEVEGLGENCRVSETAAADGISAESCPQVRGSIASLECSKESERSVSYNAIIDADARFYDTYTAMAADGINGLPAENINMKNICFTNLVTKAPSRFTVKDKIEISRDKPNIDSVVGLKVRPVNISADMKNEGMSLTGDLDATLLYNGEEDGSPLEVFTDSMPIDGVIEVCDANEEMLCCPEVYIEDVYYSVIADSDGESRIVEIECKLCVYPNVYENISMDILDDAYCLDKVLELDRKKVKGFRNICKNISQYPIKQPIETDGEDMLRIYCAFGRVTVDNVSVRQGKTLVEGVLEVDVLYVAENDKDPVCSFKGEIPFSQMLETRGSEEGMKAYVTASPQHLGFNMLSQREVEIRGMLSISCIINEDIEFDIITDMEERPMPVGRLENMPSVTVYIVKKGDTLWKLAKKFNTTVGEIAEINEIEDPDLIYPGQRLIILKEIYREE